MKRLSCFSIYFLFVLLIGVPSKEVSAFSIASCRSQLNLKSKPNEMVVTIYFNRSNNGSTEIEVTVNKRKFNCEWDRIREFLEELRDELLKENPSITCPTLNFLPTSSNSLLSPEEVSKYLDESGLELITSKIVNIQILCNGS